MENENIKNSSENEEKFYQKIGFWIFIGILWWVLSFAIFFAWNLQISAPEFLKIFEKIEAKDIWDSFNILNSLVGIFTIILVYFTYKTQKEELQETRKTLENQEKEMQEQNRQQYIKFLLEQKNSLLEKISYQYKDMRGGHLKVLEKKWFEVFDYWMKQNGCNFPEYIFARDFYLPSWNFLNNYKNLCQYIEEEFKKTKNTEKLTFLAISPEEKFCFEKMSFIDKKLNISN